MKKILAFGASNSQNSINKKLASYTANLFENATVEVLDLNDFEMPIYSIDREKKDGLPQLAHDFYDKITACFFLHFFRSVFPLIGCNAPGVSERVSYFSETVAPECIAWRHDGLEAIFDCGVIKLIAFVNIKPLAAGYGFFRTLFKIVWHHIVHHDV